MEFELYFFIESAAYNRPETSSPQGILLHNTTRKGLDWLIDWLTLGSSPYGPDAHRPYRQVNTQGVVEIA